MSDATKSVLAGKTVEGAVRVADAGLRGMITIRGDLTATRIKAAVTGVAGVAFPGQGEASCVDDKGILWMSPDEVMVLCAYGERDATLQAVQNKIGADHSLAVDVSDARAIFQLSGDEGALRETLAKLTPADVSPSALPTGRFRRTRLAQIPCAFWFRDPQTVELIVFRSVAQYAFDLLENAAKS
ncbi:MAG: sarcosine oxidase subunit gamma family protein, partial [Pseudomonadota bacterium]